jgi:hypothetical protein
MCPRFSVLCCPVYRQRPYDGLISRPRSPTKCPKIVSEVKFWIGEGRRA